MFAYVREAYIRTNLQPKMVELISFKITTMDFLCYLNLFDSENLGTIKLVNVGLTDQQVQFLLEFMGHKKVERLVLTGNKLTDQVIPMFLGRSLPHLKELYLARNRINKYRMK